MRLQDKLVSYLEYCTYRKELDQKTVKAYRIDLNQYFTFVACEEPDKEKIEEYLCRHQDAVIYDLQDNQGCYPSILRQYD